MKQRVLSKIESQLVGISIIRILGGKLPTFGEQIAFMHSTTGTLAGSCTTKSYKKNLSKNKSAVMQDEKDQPLTTLWGFYE